MPQTMTQPYVETEGKKSADAFQPPAGLERAGKAIAIRCLSAAIESFIAARNWSRAQLAEDICGMPEANFSKIANGKQGDFWELVYKLPADVRADFFERLHESEHSDPLALALEQLNAAMVRVWMLTSGEKRSMVKANLPTARAERKRA